MMGVGRHSRFLHRVYRPPLFRAPHPSCPLTHPRPDSLGFSGSSACATQTMELYRRTLKPCHFTTQVVCFVSEASPQWGMSVKEM